MTETNSDQDIDIARTLGIDQTGARRKRLKRWLGWSALVLITVIAVIVFSMGNSADTVRYKTKEVERGDLTITVTATGNLEPTNKVDVGTEVSGTIKTVEADYNDRVKVGQVLARLDTSKLEAQVLQARGALESARAKVIKAKARVKETEAELARLQRVLKLSGGKVPSQSDLDAAVAAFQTAQAEEAVAKAAVSEAQASLKLHETNLSKAVILSPINGIVLVRNVEPGQTVAASWQTPVLFTLAEDLKKMELRVDVDEADVGQVRAGQNAVFTVDAYPDRTFEARVTEVRFASKTVEGVVTYETLLAVDNSDLSLRPGMTATADITVKHVEDALLVPNAALRFTPAEHSPKLAKKRRGLLGALLPSPPRRLKQAKQKKSPGNKRQKRVWRLLDGELAPITITVGATDGRRTEVVAGDIEQGVRLVVGTVKQK